MEISSFNQTYVDMSLNDVVNSLSQGLRNNIPYPDTQTYTLSRLTIDVIKGNEIILFDKEYTSTQDTLELIMELESKVQGILETDYDPSVQNGAAIIAVLKI